MSIQPKKLIKSSSATELTPEQIYDIVMGKDKGGIQGYKCPRHYYDYHEVMWLRKREQILKKHKAVWPPENWKSNKETGNKEPPKKTNFIDERIKWAKSFNDPKREQEVKEALEAKGQKIGELNPFKSDFDKKINKLNLLNAFKDREAQLKKIKEQINAIPEYKQNAIEQVQEKIKSNEYKPRQGKSNWSRCTRIMYNADSEFMGEQVPFWNPNSKEEDKKKAEFNPNKIKYMYRDPIWSIGPKKKDDTTSQDASQYIKARDERLEEKANSVLEKMGIDKKKYRLEPVESYNKVDKHGFLPLLIRKVYDYANTEQYKASLEQRNSETPAPNTYWDDGKSKVKIRKNVDDDQAKKWEMPREKTYKRLYVSGMRKSVY